MVKSRQSTALKEAAPDLSPELLDRISRFDFDIPPAKSLSNGETEGLAVEALEAYAYGRRTRFDTRGRLWEYTREVDGNQFQLRVTVSIASLQLATGAVGLDRIAGKEGENEMIALVFDLARRSVDLQAAACAAQVAMRTEGDGPETVWDGVEPGFAHDHEPVRLAAVSQAAAEAIADASETTDPPPEEVPPEEPPPTEPVADPSPADGDGAPPPSEPPSGAAL